jgi:uncharacterized membrane protein
MLSYPRILRKALLLVVLITLADAAAAYGLTIIGYSFAGVFGDILLAEIAVLFILAFLMDFANSTRMRQFRRALQISDEKGSMSANKETQQRAILTLTIGLVLFMVLVALGIYMR